MTRKNYALTVNKVNKYFKDEEKKRLVDMFVEPNKEDMFHSVKDMSFKVERGQIFGVLGPNGCGKSTLIRMITTLVIPDDGTIKVFGIDVEQYPHKVKDYIGRVSVDASFFMKLTALENLDYAAGLYGQDKKQTRKVAIEILKDLGFPKEKMYISLEKLSRGQQQKVAIARGFLAQPRLLLLDEPTTGLDPVSKLDVQKFIRKITKEQDVTIVITSHDMEEIDKLCNELVIMSEGKVIAQGTPQELKTSNCDEQLFELKTTKPQKTKQLVQTIEGVQDVTLKRDERNEWKLTMRIQNVDAVIGTVIKKLSQESIGLVRIGHITPTLEDVFVKLTGKTMEHVEE